MTEQNSQDGMNLKDNSFTSPPFELRPNESKLAFYKLLKRANLTLDVPVEIMIGYEPKDATPCITMYDAGTGNETNYYYYRKTTLPKNHPHYDPAHPNELYITERVLHTVLYGAISLHIWGNNTPQKDSLIYQVRLAIKKIFMGDYSQCTNYDNGNCKTTGKTCDAISVKNAYGISNMCPYLDVIDINDPNYRNPDDAFGEHNMHGFEIGHPQDLDELGVVPEVYHSSILITYYRDEEYVTPTAPYCEYQEGTEEVEK